MIIIDGVFLSQAAIVFVGSLAIGAVIGGLAGLIYCLKCNFEEKRHKK